MAGIPCRKFCLAIIACLFVSTPYITLYALSSSGGPSSSVGPTIEQPLENSSFPVTIRVETDKSRYALGEIVQFKTFLVNKGPDTLKIGPVNYRFMVFDPSGTIVWDLYVNSIWNSDWSLNIPPNGETILDDSLMWAQYVMRCEDSVWTTERATPGIYALRVDTSGAVTVTAEVTILIR